MSDALLACVAMPVVLDTPRVLMKGTWRGGHREFEQDRGMLSGHVSHGCLVWDRDGSRVLYERLRAKHSAQAAQFVDEFDVCRPARVDIAVVNDALSGHEIQSERDTLRGLVPRQDSNLRHTCRKNLLTLGLQRDVPVLLRR